MNWALILRALLAAVGGGFLLNGLLTALYALVFWGVFLRGADAGPVQTEELGLFLFVIGGVSGFTGAMACVTAAAVVGVLRSLSPAGRIAAGGMTGIVSSVHNYWHMFGAADKGSLALLVGGVVITGVTAALVSAWVVRLARKAAAAPAAAKDSVHS